jgi:hypothetical protein
MSEEITQEMNGARPLLERILMRLDSIDKRLNTLGEKSERQAIETKPIWERALVEIVETRQDMNAFRREMNLEMRVIHEDTRRSRVEIEDLKDRVDILEKNPS